MHATVKLDKDASRRAVENAIRTQAQIVLESQAFGETTVNGFLICGDESALLLETTGSTDLSAERILNARCEARLYADQRYRFSTVIKAVPQWGNSRSIAIERPTTISVMDRRRFLRARLAPSSEVTLEWVRAETTHRHVAVLLNISAEGLACRIDAGAALAIDRDDAIQVRFGFPNVGHQFNLGSTVSNKTAASEGCTILGLQFERSPDVADDLRLLRDAVQNNQQATTQSEVFA
jgi:hypothetical protein